MPQGARFGALSARFGCPSRRFVTSAARSCTAAAHVRNAATRPELQVSRTGGTGQTAPPEASPKQRCSSRRSRGYSSWRSHLGCLICVLLEILWQHLLVAALRRIRRTPPPTPPEISNRLRRQPCGRHTAGAKSAGPPQPPASTPRVCPSDQRATAVRPNGRRRAP